MPNLVVLGLVAVVAFGLLKVLSNKPLDKDGRIVLTMRDRVVSFAILACLTAFVIFSQVKIYGIDNPLILISPMLIATVIVLKHHNKNKEK